MKKKVIILSIISTLLLTSLVWGAINNGNCVSGISSVDNKEIRWGGSTKYKTNLTDSIKEWNALGKINIAPDNAWTIEDVTFKDTSNTAYIWLGLYQKGIITDTITFNTNLLDKTENSNKVTNTVLHEIGHALGINDHNDLTMCGEKSLVMWYKANTYTTLQKHDKDVYNQIYTK